VDFGEEADVKQVLLVEAAPGVPARVRPVPVAAARPLRTVRGTVVELAQMAAGLQGALVRAVVTEPRRAGLADEVRAVLPNVLEVRIEQPETAAPVVTVRQGRLPQELFDAYLAEQGVDDPRLAALFAELLDAELVRGGH
jgi:exonuclease SbcD